MGYLYPDSKTALMNCQNLDQLRDIAKGVEVYKDVLKDAPDPQKPDDMGHGQKSLDDLMYEEECKKYELAWD